MHSIAAYLKNVTSYYKSTSRKNEIYADRSGMLALLSSLKRYAKSVGISQAGPSILSEVVANVPAMHATIDITCNR
tara:strand:+ start:265 stop:492 length:228 start_codon:yes stop_codon:yes gene_type:complete